MSIHAHRADGRIVIDVADECGGLSPGTEDLLFEPFQRGEKDHHGLGVGLSIASRAVQSMDGAIHVCNLPGTGCVFSIDLPNERMMASAQQADVSPVSSPAARKEMTMP